jgi:hypothetical protein
MSTTRMPGFAAETSLYKTKAHYRNAGFLPPLHKAIYPAQGGEPVEVVDIGNLDFGFERKWGVVAGASKQDKFWACLETCQADPRATDADCQRSCCLEFTGKEVCYVA